MGEVTVAPAVGRPGAGARAAGARVAAVSALVVALVAVVFRAPGQPLLVTVAVAAVLTAGCALVTASAAGAEAGYLVCALCCAAVVGAAVQLRLGAAPTRVVVFSVIAAAVFAAVLLAARRLSAVEPESLGRVAAWTVVGCFALRVLAPFPLDVRGLSYVVAGTLAVPGTGLSVQVGEFTRIAFVVALGMVMWSVATAAKAGGPAPFTPKQLWVVGGAAAGYLAALAVLDSGPFLLTVVGLTIVAVAVFGVRGIARGVWRWLRSPLGLAALGAGLLVVAVGASQIDDLATRVPGRVLSLFSPNEQMAAGFEAMQRGGLVGAGLGTSPFARGVPVGESDLMPMVLAADAGLAVMAGLGILLVGVLGAVAVRPLHREGLWGVLGAAVGVMVFAQAAWALLANVGIAPLTGISTPFLVVMFSGLVASAASVGLCLGLSPAADAPPAQPPLAGGRARLARAVTGVRRGTQIVVASAAAILILFVPPVSNAAQIYMPRGDILTVDGEVIATTGGDGRRAYPLGRRYTEVGLVHRGGVQYGVEGAAADELTCGGAPSVADRIFIVLRPLPCTPADVVTTLDAGLQTAAQQALEGLQGSVAVFDSATGQVRALYSSKDVDPNEFRAKPLTGGPPVMAARQDQVEPGSVYKIITAAAGLLDGVDMSGAPLETFTGGGEVLRNAGGARCPSTSVVDLLAFSCNTTTAHIAVAVGQQRLGEVAATYFGAGATTPFDIGDGALAGIDPGTTGGALTAGQLARTSIGQEGARGNTLAVAVATGAVARAASAGQPGTALPAPRLIEGYCRGGGFEPATPAQTVGQPLPTSVADTIARGMAKAVTNGTATALSAPGRTLAAKTGTAEVGGGGDQVNSWVTVIIDGRWVLAVMLHSTTGGATATGVADGLLAAFPTDFPQPQCP